MPEQKPRTDCSSPAPRRSKREVVPGKHAQADGLELRSYEVGALPLLDRIIARMQLQRLLSEHLPRDDSRTELSTVTTLLVLFANLLMAREPVYGVGEWAALFPPDLLGLRTQDLARLHDDRLGRCLDRMFEGIGPTLIMAVVRHVIREFNVGLDELHNDSTTVSFYGAYDDAGQESEQRGRPTHAITWGHSKARRPDLKQLLYILTVTSDGNVPVYLSRSFATRLLPFSRPRSRNLRILRSLHLTKYRLNEVLACCVEAFTSLRPKFLPHPFLDAC